jgi:hypothetical protein
VGRAGYHTGRRLIVVACDHLGFGDSDDPRRQRLDYDNTALGNPATVEAVMELIEQGTLADDFRRSAGGEVRHRAPMGGCYTIVLARPARPVRRSPAGYSAIHTIVPSRPGTPPRSAAARALNSTT